MELSLPHYQTAAENFSSGKNLQGKMRGKESGSKKKTNTTQKNKTPIFLHTTAVAEWEGSVSFGDVTSLSLPGFPKGPPGWHEVMGDEGGGIFLL